MNNPTHPASEARQQGQAPVPPLKVLTITKAQLDSLGQMRQVFQALCSPQGEHNQVAQDVIAIETVLMAAQDGLVQIRIEPSECGSESEAHGGAVGESSPLAPEPEWKGVYPGMCINPEICRGHSHCPRNYSCCE